MNEEKPTTKAYLARMCNDINNARHGVLYIKTFDNVLEEYLESEHATWLQKNRYNGGQVWIPRYNTSFYIVRANENARGYKPRKAIIDSRIELDTIRLIIEPSLIVCTECTYF